MNRIDRRQSPSSRSQRIVNRAERLEHALLCILSAIAFGLLLSMFVDEGGRDSYQHANWTVMQ